jgi:toxin ParE1/3/4
MADKYTIQFSARAERDFKSIQRYTLKNFGEKQVWIYTGMLKEGLRRLEENPKLYGHTRPDIPQIYRSYKIAEHSLIYRIEERTVFLLAILHGNMDFKSHLKK